MSPDNHQQLWIHQVYDVVCLFASDIAVFLYLLEEQHKDSLREKLFGVDPVDAVDVADGKPTGLLTYERRHRDSETD